MSTPLSPDFSTVSPEEFNSQVLVGEKRQRSDEREQQALPDSSAKKRKFIYKSRQQVLDESPSILDGLTVEKEASWRRQYCRVISKAGIALKIPQWGIWTALLLCHRFFAIKSMKKNDRFQIATACLFLASKLEESVRNLVTVIKEMEKQRYETKPNMLKKLDDAAHIDLLKDETLQAERAVLYTLGFDLNINHPYKHVLAKLKELGLLGDNVPKINPKVLQNAWNFVNDCHRTLLCLQHPPEEIAAAALYLANTMMNIQPKVDHLPFPEGQDFFKFFKIDIGTINLITGEMLEIYEQVKLPTEPQKLLGSSTSPPSTQDASSSQNFPSEMGFKTEQSTPENKPDQIPQQQQQQQSHQHHHQQHPQHPQLWQYGQQLPHGNVSSNGNMNGGPVKAEPRGNQ